MDYEKAAAEIIYFTNRDVITTSGGSGGRCLKPGWDNGNGCNNNSGNCPGRMWK